MVATVLGKRTRSSARSAAAEQKPTQPTRITRNSKFVIGLDNDENENPFITPKKRDTPLKVNATEIDESAEEESPAKRTRTSNTAPLKHGAIEARVALSPAKINAHFKSSKSSTSTDSKTGATPSTPRHRDAAANKVVVTPRHRVLLPGKPLTPRTPRTPTTPRTTVPTIYNDARQLFIRGVQPGRLIGREEERKELHQFVSSRTTSKKSGCLYISGPPGTGKSALVDEICNELDKDSSVKRAYINCMSIKSAGEIYVKLLEEIGEAEDVLEGSEKDTLQEILFKRDTSYVITLDEVDYLLELDLELLYTLFEWSMRPKTSLVLLGIANALDLTDRFLPRLKSKGLKPQLLPFMPYSAEQIASVISSKLRSLLPADSTAAADFIPFLHPMAVQFLSKKVAAQTGDLRKTFDICRRAIDVIETETREKHAKAITPEETPASSPSPSKATPLLENMNLSSPAVPRTTQPKAQQQQQASALQTSLAQLTPETAPRASIAHMARVTAAVFGNGVAQRLKTLNLQQKAVLCALAALERKLSSAPSSTVPSTPSKHAKVAAPTLKQLYDAYASLCRREKALHPLSRTEFADVCTSLEAASLVSAVAERGSGGGGSFSSSFSGSFGASQPGTPSRRGRKPSGVGAEVVVSGLVESRRVASVVGVKELGGAVLGGVGGEVLRGLLFGEGDVGVDG
ncbi:uncharacterized protein K452DRAFT_271502 [Aplosporella prunicola CBS 121167]|uniref:Cell division control protein n=1 Tax=Aplosporella prunicola CBS 121167 TaxID=1176127 RepID=A0A6A6BE19_9PEZI|nr:uncharacterized protein K452DRAFT_271502 [Aplosporella prunicola CBS 121167]KAF2141758.1 hypothetical protein K452DRAFT_271502 [Aplosporella prunicola CBS 121167]